MREHQHEPGKGNAASSPHGHDAPAVGKSSLTQNVKASAASAEPTAQASSSDAEVEINRQFEHAANAANYIHDERIRALTELDRVLQQHTEEVPNSLLAELGKTALDLATDQIGGMVVQQVVQPVKGLVERKIFDGTKNATHVRVERTNQHAHAFVQLQEHALNKAQKTTMDRVSDVKASILHDLNKHSGHRTSAIDHAKSIAAALGSQGKNVFQIQYNISIAKWFAALSQSSFGGNPNRKGASNLGKDRLATNPVNSGGRSNFGAKEYHGKQGFVHMEVFVGFTGAAKITRFATPGIDPHAWSLRDPAGADKGDDPQLAKPLGEFALNDLLQRIHLPVVADVKFYFDPRDSKAKDHFPTGHGPIAISWNEKNIVTVELPTRGDDFPVTTADRTFLAKSFAHALHKGDVNEAAKWLLTEKIGQHGMGFLHAHQNQEIK
ncbi:MAG TPA: hypothetical protein VLM79_39290 [Kofleriaceae bacterium]|nr:hypothetical protein [Kofleriaceae bacterium]